MGENWSSGIPPDGDTVFTFIVTTLTPRLQDPMYLANKSLCLKFLKEASKYQNDISVDVH